MKRIYWLDVARFVAIILVVFTHSHERAGVQDLLSKSVFYTIDRLGVPIFFMISGGLILDKIKSTPMLPFYLKRIPQFLIVLVAYCIATNIIKCFTEGVGILESVILSVTEFNGVTNTSEHLGIYGGARQMWYMYAIIQLYLIYPFLARMVSNLTTRQVFGFMFLCLFFGQIIRTADAFSIHSDFVKKMPSEFLGVYIPYVLLGYLIIRRDILKKLSRAYILTFSMLLFIVPISLLIFADLSTGKLINNMHWYSDSLFVFTSGAGLFVLLKFFFDGDYRESRFIIAVSKFSFGIYLSHYAFLYVILSINQHYLNITDAMFLTVALFVTAFLFSMVFVRIMFANSISAYFVK